MINKSIGSTYIKDVSNQKTITIFKPFYEFYNNKYYIVLGEYSGIFVPHEKYCQISVRLPVLPPIDRETWIDIDWNPINRYADINGCDDYFSNSGHNGSDKFSKNNSYLLSEILSPNNRPYIIMIELLLIFIFVIFLIIYIFYVIKQLVKSSK